MTSAERVEERPKDRYVGRKINNLQIIDCIGVGGFGAVYRAEHEKLGTAFAVKLLHLQHLDNDKLIQRFEREARTIAQLSHPHIIRVSDFGQMADGSYYLVMDFLEGVTLNKAIEQGRQFSFTELKMLFQQICSALDYVHRKNIVHRDLKPENIFLELDPHKKDIQVKILDFGIAGIAREPTLTGTGTVLGSPIYMSPEQIQGNTKEADARSDLYSLGVVLFQTIIGEPPFFAQDLLGVLYKHVHDPIPLLQKQRPAIQWTPALQSVLECALAKEPTSRYQNAESFIQALETALTKQEELTPDLSFPYKQGAETIAHHETILPMQTPIRSSLLPSGQISQSIQLMVSNPKGRYLSLFLLLTFLVGGWYAYAYLTAPQKQLNVAKAQATPTKRAAAPRPPTLPKMPDPAPPRPPEKRKVVPLKITVTIDAYPKKTEVWQGETLLGQVPQKVEGKPETAYSLELRAKKHRPLPVKGVFPLQGRILRFFKLRKIPPKRRRRKARRRKLKRRPPPRRRVFEIDVFK